MKWRVPGQEVDQRTLERDCGKRCQACRVNREDAVNHNRWRKQIRDD